MDPQVRRQLGRRRDELCDLKSLGSECRVGLITAEPAAELSHAEWDYVDRHVVSLGFGQQRIPVEFRSTSSDPLPTADSCLTWRGEQSTIAEFKKWAAFTSGTLRNCPDLVPGMLIEEGHYGTICAFIDLIRTVPTLASEMVTQLVLNLNTMPAQEASQLFPNLNHLQPLPVFSACHLGVDSVKTALMIVDHLLERVPIPSALKDLGQMLADRFHLASPLNERQAAFLQCLIDAHGELRDFATMVRQHPILQGENPTRLKNSLPKTVKQLVQSKPGGGYRILLK